MKVSVTEFLFILACVLCWKMLFSRWFVCLWDILWLSHICEIVPSRIIREGMFCKKRKSVPPCLEQVCLILGRFWLYLADVALVLVNRVGYLCYIQHVLVMDKWLSFSFLVLHFCRALNEMWKCQNMLRSHVRELLDLHKQPTVRFWKYYYFIQWTC